MDKLVEVTQEDRKIASAITRNGAPGRNGNKVVAAEIKDGLHDDSFVVQSYARHRLFTRPDPTDAASVEERERWAVARCIELVREVCDDFLSPDYATPQPVGSFVERFACSLVAERLENEFGLGTIEQCRLLGKPTPFELYAAEQRQDAAPPTAIRKDAS